MGIEFRMKSYVQHMVFIVKSNRLDRDVGHINVENIFQLFSIKFPQWV